MDHLMKLQIINRVARIRVMGKDRFVEREKAQGHTF